MAVPDSARSIVVVGSINADLGVSVDRFPQPGETIPAAGGEFSPGGKGANQALAARLCGAQVTMLGAVGDDAAAEPALKLMREAGVDLDHVQVHPGPTGIAVVTVDSNGENQIMVIPGANAAMTASQVEAAEDVLRTAAVVVLQGEIPAEGINRATELTAGRVVLNMAPVQPLPSKVLRRADPLVVNEHEGALTLELLGHPVSKDITPEEIVTQLHENGCRSIVMTLGAQGALICQDGSVAHIPGRTVTDVVDTTGAGDAFVGALAARLAVGETLSGCATYANQVAAATVTRAGAQSSYSAITVPETP